MYLFALEEDNTQLRVGEGAIPDLSVVWDVDLLCSGERLVTTMGVTAESKFDRKAQANPRLIVKGIWATRAM